MPISKTAIAFPDQTGGQRYVYLRIQNCALSVRAKSLIEPRHSSEKRRLQGSTIKRWQAPLSTAAHAARSKGVRWLPAREGMA